MNQIIAMESRLMGSILKFYEILSFNSQHPTTAKYHIKIRTIFFVHISIATFFAAFKLYVLNYLRSIAEPLLLLSEISQYSTVLFTYWIIIIESNKNEKNQRLFWKLFRKIDETFRSQNEMERQWRGYLTILFVIFFVKFFAAASFSIQKNLNEFFVSSGYFYLIALSQLRNFYYLFYLKLVQFQLQSIENELKLIVRKGTTREFDQYGFGHTQMFKSYELNRIKWVRKFYLIVYEMSNNLNEVFGWSQVAIILSLFNYQLTHLNWAYLHLKENSPFLIFGEEV